MYDNLKDIFGHLPNFHDDKLKLILRIVFNVQNKTLRFKKSSERIDILRLNYLTKLILLLLVIILVLFQIFRLLVSAR